MKPKKIPEKRRPLRNAVKKNLPTILVFVLLSLLLLDYSTWEVSDPDEGIYLTVIQDLLDGGQLYVTSWEHKGPGLFLIYMPPLLLFGNDIVAVRIWHGLLVLTSIIFIYKALRMFTGKHLALTAILLYGVFLKSRVLGGLSLNGEHGMSFFIIPAAYLFLKRVLDGGDDRLLFASGALSSMAVLTKATALFSIIVFPILLAFWSLREDKKYFSCLAWFLAGLAIVSAVTASYFLLTQTFTEFFKAFYTVNQDYQALTPFAEKMRKLAVFYRESFFRDPLILFGNIGFVLTALNITGKINSKKWLFVTSFFLFSLIGTNWGGFMFGHYFIQMGFPLSLALGCGVDSILRGRWTRRLLILAIISALLTSNIPGIIREFPLVNGELDEAPLHLVGRYIQGNTGEEDKMYHQGFYINIYFFADRRPATKYFTNLWHQGWRREIINPENHTIGDFKKNPPEIVVLEKPHETYKTYLNSIIYDNYRLEKNIGRYDIYRLKDEAEQPV